MTWVLTIPNSVTVIGGHAFEGCTSLESITIPSSVTEIGGSAFHKCPKLTIKAPEGSCAAKCAKENGIKYVEL